MGQILTEMLIYWTELPLILMRAQWEDDSDKYAICVFFLKCKCKKIYKSILFVCNIKGNTFIIPIIILKNYLKFCNGKYLFLLAIHFKINMQEHIIIVKTKKSIRWLNISLETSIIGIYKENKVLLI